MKKKNKVRISALILTFLIIIQSSLTVFAQDINMQTDLYIEPYEIIFHICADELLAEAGLARERTIAHTINFTASQHFNVNCTRGCGGFVTGHGILSGSVTFNANGTLTPHGVPSFRAYTSFGGPDGPYIWQGNASLFDNRFNLLNNNRTVEARGTISATATKFWGIWPECHCRFPNIIITHRIS